ncbi:OmpH family outer membrane protein [Rhizomicrobium electricum]|jgi:Skp family chaperone for outer membrane proteins|uniref:OmpH family outer membrane protein n=1 Tax=Rhizomicrobium electricum TaxID=480070 RepID=A0ABP3PTS3_9PROT|nr:OmpH family outer membrane protein [Rhizomicrobium electricum]NIJ48946.1 Skp family chaperone for outer membrane proteins [Rhizomicrobium electricum]
MSKKTLITRSLAAAAMVIAATATVPSALAAAPGTGAAPAARILIIDLRRTVAMSKVGQSIQQQVDGLKKQAQTQLNAEAESLKRDKAQMDAQNAILAPAVKAQKENAWKARAMAFEKKVQERGGLIQGGMLKANQQVEEALGPILQGVMQERKATVLLDRASVLLAPNAIDVTAVVVQRLDMKMPTVKVDLAPLPPALQQAAARQQAAQQ